MKPIMELFYLYTITSIVLALILMVHILTKFLRKMVSLFYTLNMFDSVGILLHKYFD